MYVKVLHCFFYILFHKRTFFFIKEDFHCLVYQFCITKVLFKKSGCAVNCHIVLN